MRNNSKTAPVQMSVKKTIEEHRLIAPEDGLVIGVSGGPDSTCLLHCLWSLGYTQDGRLHAVHLNHMLRGEDADGDQKYTEDFCRNLRIPCHTFQADIEQMAKTEGTSFEVCGRQQRYKYFQQILIQVFGGKGKIVVAQNKNDQAETVLMRILRGTGIAGLGAMDYIRDDLVIRPLLNVLRRDIEDYCQENQLNPRTDKTNQQAVYTRNRIRLELIPNIEAQFNPNIISALTNLAELSREDNKFIETIAEDIFHTHWNRMEKSLPASVIQSQPLSIQRRLVMKGLKEVGLGKNIAMYHVENLLSIIKEEAEPKYAEFSEGFTVRLSYKKLWFINKNKDSNEEFFYQIKRITVEEMQLMLKNREKKGPPKRSFLDYEELVAGGIPYQVRTRQGGDWIRPLGMKGTKKMKDYFIDKKIPVWKRERIPLLAIGSEIAWIYGGAISENFKITEKTKEILCIEYF